MKIIVTAYYEFIKNLRDIKMLACLLVFPILITFLLGNALGGYLSKDSPDKIPVGYVNMDRGTLGDEFNKFLQNEEIKKRLQITNFDNRGEAQAAVEGSRVDSVIYIPSSGGERVTIELFGKKNVEFVEGITRSFVSTLNSVTAVISSGGIPQAVEEESSLQRMYFTKDASAPKIMDYYAILELLQVLVLGSIFGISIVTRSSESDMHVRVHSLPASRFTLTLGRVLGSSLYLFAISIVVILFTKYVYGVNWNGNQLVILGALLSMSIISVGIGVLVGTLVPSFSTALMIVLLLMLFFGIFSGAISPASAEGSLGKFIPNYHAKILILGTIYKYPRGVMLNSMLWLGGFITVIYGLSSALIRRIKYDNI